MPSIPHPPAAVLSTGERAILSALLYFDIFGHPLTAAEIARFAPSVRLSADEVARLCRGASLDVLVREVEGHYMMRSTSGDPVGRRRAREASARRLVRIARIVGRTVAAIPYVRSVCISGELSKGVAGPDSDIDLVIIADERRLWIVRTMLVLMKRIFLLGRRRYLCLNHLQTIDHLATTARSYYDAVEVVTLQHVGGEPILGRILRANPWIAEMLPNAMADGGIEVPSDPTHRRSSRSTLVSRWIDRLDARLMAFWERAWTRRYPGLTLMERRRRFACTPYLSTAYGSDSSEPILTMWRSRLAEHGLSPMETAAA